MTYQIVYWDWTAYAPGILTLYFSEDICSSLAYREKHRLPKENHSALEVMFTILHIQVT